MGLTSLGKKMSKFESITIDLREVESSDLEPFYEHQLDPKQLGCSIRL